MYNNKAATGCTKIPRHIYDITSIIHGLPRRYFCLNVVAQVNYHFMAWHWLRIIILVISTIEIDHPSLHLRNSFIILIEPHWAGSHGRVDLDQLIEKMGVRTFQFQHTNCLSHFQDGFMTCQE